PEQFNAYPPQAKRLATNHIDSMKRLPLSFLPSVLREVIEYDWKFPVERQELEKQFVLLDSLSAEQLKEWFQGFSQIRLSSQLERLDWINAPAKFVEQLSDHLWTTHQVDAFHAAAIEYAGRLQTAVPPEPPPAPRLGIAVIGQGASASSFPLFRKLRPHGVYFNRVKPEDGLKLLLDAVADRAKAHPAAYGHWYIDGGQQSEHDAALICVSYSAMEPVRAALLRKMQAEIQSAGMGPERLRTILAQMRPADLGLNTGDPVLDRFQVSLLTEGSGTQIFSTTFAQWAAREALRRAQPLTLLVRFAPRQRQKPMNELLSGTHPQAELDPAGSLVDADMGAYYHWLDQQRLSGAERSSFLVWFEDHGEALVIGPSMPRGAQSSASAGIRELLAWIS
ncbi:MAG TPA: hypothetical protein VFZ99_01510, partial [Terriglobales bacterium]